MSAPVIHRRVYSTPARCRSTDADLLLFGIISSVFKRELLLDLLDRHNRHQLRGRSLGFQKCTGVGGFRREGARNAEPAALGGGLLVCLPRGLFRGLARRLPYHVLIKVADPGKLRLKFRLAARGHHHGFSFGRAFALKEILSSGVASDPQEVVAQRTFSFQPFFLSRLALRLWRGPLIHWFNNCVVP